MPKQNINSEITESEATKDKIEIIQIILSQEGKFWNIERKFQTVTVFKEHKEYLKTAKWSFISSFF